MIAADRERIGPDKARTTVYFTLHHLMAANADVLLYRRAFIKLVNSLHWNDRVYTVADLSVPGGHGLILRVDTEEMGWSGRFIRHNLVNTIIQPSAFAVQVNFFDLTDVYDEEASQTNLGARQAVSLGRMSKRLGGAAPVDAFLWAASRPPLYHDLLQLPETLGSLESYLGVNVDANIRDGNVLRSGTAHSGPSTADRLIERHEARYGAYWLSYDFSRDLRDPQNSLLVKPFGPVGAGLPGPQFFHDGGEVIFNLPNGMQAYMLADGNGNRVDTGPINIVRDFRGVLRDPTVINGASCMGCHGLGINYSTDELLPAWEEAGLATPWMRRTHDPERMEEAMDRDVEMFRQASLAMGIDPSQGDPIEFALIDYDLSLTVERAAAELGVGTDELLALAESDDKDIRLVVAYLRQNGVPRDVWTKHWSQLDRELRK